MKSGTTEWNLDDWFVNYEFFIVKIVKFLKIDLVVQSSWNCVSVDITLLTEGISWVSTHRILILYLIMILHECKVIEDFILIKINFKKSLHANKKDIEKSLSCHFSFFYEVSTGVWPITVWLIFIEPIDLEVRLTFILRKLPTKFYHAWKWAEHVQRGLKKVVAIDLYNTLCAFDW